MYNENFLRPHLALISARAEKLLDSFSIYDISQMTFDDLKRQGLTSHQAKLLQACFVIGRNSVNKVQEEEKITMSSQAYNIMREDLENLDHEQFWALYLNNQHKPIKKYLLSKGTYTGTLVDIRILLREALICKATSMMLFHNHPSGSLSPSAADREITRKVVDAAGTMDIKVLDHLIITSSAYYSFSDEGLI
jgi:DNA repair protein RadC